MMLIMNLSPSQTHELVTGRTPFAAFAREHLVPQFQKVIGGVPKKWVRDGLSNGVLKKSIDGKFTPIKLKSG